MLWTSFDEAISVGHGGKSEQQAIHLLKNIRFRQQAKKWIKWIRSVRCSTRALDFSARVIQSGEEIGKIERAFANVQSESGEENEYLRRRERRPNCLTGLFEIADKDISLELASTDLTTKITSTSIKDVLDMKKDEMLIIPEDINYDDVFGLSAEDKETRKRSTGNAWPRQ